MSSKNETNTANQLRKRRLLPLIAIVAGMILPVYAWANCESCYNGCSVTYNAEVANCYSWYSPGPDQQWCLAQAYDRMQLCFNGCAGCG